MRINQCGSRVKMRNLEGSQHLLLLRYRRCVAREGAGYRNGTLDCARVRFVNADLVFDRRSRLGNRHSPPVVAVRTVMRIRHLGGLRVSDACATRAFRIRSVAGVINKRAEPEADRVSLGPKV